MPSFHPNVRPGLPKNISTHLLAVAGSRSERTAKVWIGSEMFFRCARPRST